MSSDISTWSDLGTPRHGRAWTDPQGRTYSSVGLAGASITFSSPEDAEALSAACLEAAEAHRRQQAAHEQAKVQSTDNE